MPDDKVRNGDLCVHSFNRREKALCQMGFTSMRTERVNQLGRKRWWGFEVIREEIVPEDEFIPVLHGTSTWVSEFADLPQIDARDMRKRWQDANSLKGFLSLGSKLDV